MMVFAGLSQHIYIFAAILAVRLLSFVVFHLPPSFVVSRQLGVIIRKLKTLNGVSEAFLISDSAITLAMIVIFIEKMLVSRLNAKVGKWIQLLDGLFEGGAGDVCLAGFSACIPCHILVTAGRYRACIVTGTI